MSTEVQEVEVLPESTPEIVESPADETVAKQEVKEPEARTFTQDELDAIVQKEKAKAERRALRQMREDFQRQTVQPQAAPVQQTSAPSRENFASDEAWLDARDAYRDAQREAKVQAEQRNQSQAQLATKTEKIYAQAEKIQGFDRDAFDELPITAPIAQALIESDIAPQLMAYLAKNPDDVERIAELSAARQAVELGKIELKIQTAEVKQSKAPAPITPIGGAKSAQTTGDLSKMSMEEYKAFRAKQGSRWIK